MSVASLQIPVITLDGPAGVGKSTLARAVAKSFGLAYLDTGAMFRALALRVGADIVGGASPLIHAKAQALCAAYTFELRVDENAVWQLFCNNEHVGEEIRTEEVGIMASRLATVPAVRQALKNAQRHIGQGTPLVAEGRDMGTVVFPTACCKFFLDAAAPIRAARRQAQLAEQGQYVDMAQLTAQIQERDTLDRERTVAPLRPAADAHIIDTSYLTIDAVLEKLLRTANNFVG